MPDLLLELFSEEIPARMQTRAADDLQRAMLKALADAGLDAQSARACATPRRLALAVEGLPARQPDLREERKGPRADAPQKAVDGFLRSVGLTLDQVETRDTPKGPVYFAVIERKGRPTAEVIAKVVPEMVRGFPWPKSMRWGSGNLRWVRPLHSILCLFDGKPVPFAVDKLESGDATRGHRFHARDAIRVKNFADYETKLRGAHVILDAAERKRLIREKAEEAAAASGLELVEDTALLDEVAGLVEWPVPLIGRFDKAFLDLPPEVLTASMRAHQKYFALRDPEEGALANAFVVVANLEAADGGAAIVQGNERVLRARLSDAVFFWDQDRKRTLESRVDDLEQIVFQEKLGTMRAKADRVAKLARHIAEQIGADPDKAERAGRLAKADLTTGMVYEFPELQGVMGRYYALQDGEDGDVANAIRDHYLPQGQDDPCPADSVSIAVALADRIDTLVGFWAIDEKPTGSKDPFALRRAALGVIRIVLQDELRIALLENVKCAFGPLADLKFSGRPILWGARKSHEIEATTVTILQKPEQFALDLLSFFADRLKVHLRDKGIRHDLIDAVFALPGQDDLVLIVRRVEALRDFLDTEDGANLLAGYKRATNILKIEEKKDKCRYDGAPEPKLFAQAEEKALHAAIAKARKDAAAAVEREDYKSAMAAIARLRAPVDAFFDHVTVNVAEGGNATELRRNRLNLLAQIRAALSDVADFSRIEGG